MLVEDPGMPDPVATLFEEAEVSDLQAGKWEMGIFFDKVLPWMAACQGRGNLTRTWVGEEGTYDVLAEVGIGGGTYRSAIAFTLLSLFFKAAKADDWGSSISSP